MNLPISPEPSAPARCVRSYLFKVDERCNDAKLLQLSQLHAQWQRMLPIVGAKVWKEFLLGQVSPKSLSSAVGAGSVFGGSTLPTSIKQCLAVAVEGQQRSWKSSLKLRIPRLVMRSERYAQNPALRHQMLWLNSMQAWLVSYEQQLALLSCFP